MKKMSLKAISGVALAVILLLAAAQIPASGQNGNVVGSGCATGAGQRLD